MTSARERKISECIGHSEWHQWAPGMKDVEDATFIRSRLLLSFETAELEGDTTQRAAHLAKSPVS